MRTARGLIAALINIFATVAWSQGQNDERVTLADRAIGDGSYLAAPDLWRPLALNSDGSIRDDGAWQQYAVAISRLTGESPVRPPRAGNPTDADRANIARIGHASAHNALHEIVARAHRTRIVVLNEYHLVPRSRAFALEVARALRPLGYDVLAAETFGNDADDARYARKMAAFVADGYVRRGSGYYTQDPVFAAFVREALALGYRPVAYEATSYDSKLTQAEAIQSREQQQTDYLIARAINAYPHSKILIYVGHAHVAEAPFGEDHERWMAARLKQASGIDPLTIDQTEFLRPAIDKTGIMAGAIARAKHQSVILTDRAGPVVVGQYAGAVDLQVIHPRLPQVAGRPGWLAALGRRQVPVPAALSPTAGRRLVQAFPAGAADDAVPIDQVLVEAGHKPPPLLLDQRPFVLRYQDDPPHS